MLNPNQGEWHEQVSENPEFCEICYLDRDHPPIESGELYWLWILETKDGIVYEYNICNDHRNSMFELFDQSH